MSSALRLLGGLLAGIIVTLLLLAAVEWFSNVVHPLPPGFQNTLEEMCAHVERYPAWVLAVALPMWAATAFAGTYLAGRLGNRGAAFTLGLLVVVALLSNLAMLPYPIWFKIAGMLAIPAAVAVALLIVTRRRRAPAAPLAG